MKHMPSLRGAIYKSLLIESSFHPRTLFVSLRLAASRPPPPAQVPALPRGEGNMERREGWRQNQQGICLHPELPSLPAWVLCHVHPGPDPMSNSVPAPPATGCVPGCVSFPSQGCGRESSRHWEFQKAITHRERCPFSGQTLSHQNSS